MKRTNAINNSYTGTDSAVKIIEADAHREYICFYAVSGDCEIVIGDNTFADNTITISEGRMWEPYVVPTGSVWFKGDTSILTVMY